MYLESRAWKENESEEPGGEGEAEGRGTPVRPPWASVFRCASVTLELRIADSGSGIGLAVRVRLERLDAPLVTAVADMTPFATKVTRDSELETQGHDVHTTGTVSAIQL